MRNVSSLHSFHLFLVFILFLCATLFFCAHALEKFVFLAIISFTPQQILTWYLPPSLHQSRFWQTRQCLMYYQISRVLFSVLLISTWLLPVLLLSLIKLLFSVSVKIHPSHYSFTQPLILHGSSTFQILTIEVLQILLLPSTVSFLN